MLCTTTTLHKPNLKFVTLLPINYLFGDNCGILMAEASRRVVEFAQISVFVGVVVVVVVVVVHGDYQ